MWQCTSEAPTGLISARAQSHANLLPNSESDDFETYRASSGTYWRHWQVTINDHGLQLAKLDRQPGYGRAFNFCLRTYQCHPCHVDDSLSPCLGPTRFEGPKGTDGNMEAGHRQIAIRSTAHF